MNAPRTSTTVSIPATACTGACNQGRNCTCAPRPDAPRSCDALGVCQRRATPCTGCNHEARAHDTQALPPGGFWFAPGTIEDAPRPERWTALEIGLAALGLAAAGGVVVGLLRVLIERAAL